MDVARVLQFLGLKPNKNQVNLIIWEVDDDLDGFVNYVPQMHCFWKACKTAWTWTKTWTQKII